MIAWYDNIPLLSFILLGGRCRSCQKKISWQYPSVELATAVLFCLTFLKDLASPDFSWLILRDWLLIITLIIIFVYDLRWQLVPMTVVWPMSAVILILNLVLGTAAVNLLLFAAIGTGFFLVQYLFTGGRGLGEGDIWLGLFLGLAFPAAGPFILILLLAYSSGAIISLILLATSQKGWKSAIALGPFLALGAIITLIWGEGLIDWYLRLLF
jgi:prepilin signal peptidase PulO-like enzyme (type II secretory pathway)